VAKGASQPSVVEALLRSEEPSIVWRTRVELLGEPPTSKQIRALRDVIKHSPRVKTLLSHRDRSGRIVSGKGVYAKWQGAHWILATLADLGYPAHDSALLAARDQVLGAWLAPCFYEEFTATSKADAYKRQGVPVMHGRHRRCASQQGYAIYYLLKLGLEHERVHDLVERLLHWRWPDGGWNCDKDPSACNSTFIHTVHCMRALQLYGVRYRNETALAAAKKASELFLSRRLFKRLTNGEVMRPEYVRLHYPRYWHYDVLFGLKVMAEMNLICDPRCEDALDLLESKRLADGGWPAEDRYYSVSSEFKLGADFVDWGGTSSKRMNPWVTLDALSVLKQAGRHDSHSQSSRSSALARARCTAL
jgi:hypothetical protein